MKPPFQVVGIISCVLLPVFLLLLSYQFTLLLSPLSSEQQQVFSFLDGTVNQLGDEYTPAEISHLQDVKRVMRGTDIIFYVLLLLLVLLAIIIGYSALHSGDAGGRIMLRTILYRAALTSVVVLAVMTLLTVLAFNTSFTLFHLLLFPQGNWTFPAGSMLITVFPIDFFLSLGVRIMLMALGLSGVLLGLGWNHKNGVTTSKKYGRTKIVRTQKGV